MTHNEYDAAGRIVRSTRNYDLARPQNDQNLWNIVMEYAYDVRGNQTSVTDTYGRTTSYEYDDAGRLVRTTDPMGNVSANAYNVAGQLASTTDPLGRVTTYEYDAAGRLVKTTDPLGNSSRIAYNPDGTIASMTDPLGRVTRYQYDELKRVVAVTAPDGGVTRSEYDTAGNMVASIDLLGNRTTYEYDALGRMIKQTDHLSGVTEHFYDEVGNHVQTIDPRGNATTYTYDSANRLATVTDALGNVTGYEYDDLGRRTAVVDAKGNRTTYEYDALDRVVAVIEPLGHTITTAYDALGQALSRTDSNGKVTTFEYDSLGRLVSQTDPLGNVTVFEYDAVGNQLSVTNPNGHTSSATYDPLNRPHVAIDPLGNATTTVYDAAGQVTSVSDALGNVTIFGYDAAGRQASVTDPLGNSSQNGYDTAGHLVNVTDANGVVTHFEYDALGRLTAVVENYRPGFQSSAETNVRTEYTYDANGNRLTIVDANNHVTTFTYDALNRLFQEADPLGNTWQYGYDAVGNRVSVYDANNILTTYAFDAANQLTDIDYPGTSEDVSFTYDAAGRRASMTDGLGTTTWAYDDLNRPTAINDPFGAIVGYSYDSAGNRTGLTYPDGKVVSYVYDPANRLTDVTDWNDQTTQYTYDPLGRLVSVLRPNGVESAYTYDAAGRLLALQHTTVEATLSSFRYTYDNVGNRTQAIETTPTGQTGPTILVTVTETSGLPMAGKTIYAFNGSTYTGYNKVTDVNGQVSITLPEGSYRFRVDVDGTQFWSGAENHCAIGSCGEVMISVPEAVLVSVQDTDGTPKADLKVYAFDGTTYINFNDTTNADGQVSLRLPQGSYRFRADFNGTQFWSDSQNHCDVPSCTLVSIAVTVPVIVTVQDDLGMPREGLTVYAFDGTTYANYSATTDSQGQVVFTLPEGDYRFRADEGGTQFWSGESNHCAVPGCLDATITVSLPTVVTVKDSDGALQSGIKVYAFDGTTYTNFNATTDANGQAAFTLPPGNYRFRADYNGTQFWSGASNHCAVPGCITAEVTVTTGIVVTVQDTDGTPKAGLKVYVFNGSTYTNFNSTTDSNGQVAFTLPAGSYRFRADFNGTQFWSDSQDHCSVPDCGSTVVTVTKPVSVTVQDTDGAPKSGLKVYAFNSATYTNYNKTTDANGQAVFTLPQGGYRFRADFNGTQFWSGAANHCDLPGCESAGVTVTVPVTVAVQDGSGAPVSGVKVYAFNGSTYTNYNKTTDANGLAVFTLPLGEYRFRADYNGTQYWSGVANHCTLPGCTDVSMTVGPQATTTSSATSTPVSTDTPLPTATTSAPESTATPTPTATETPVTSGGGVRLASLVRNRILQVQTGEVVVTVQDTNGGAKTGLKVYVFDGSTYTGLNATTDANGQASFTPPDGDYRFRADFNGTQFWSDSQNHCTVPGCTEATVTVTIPVTITVQDTDGTPKEGLRVYAFDGMAYTNFNATTDANGQALFTLPQGDYRFRADLNGTQFWSGESNQCTLPGCETVTVTVTKPVTVTVQDTDGTPKEGLKVYTFDGTAYTNFNGTTDVNGQAVFTLPEGDYRFRADFNGTQFWSGESNHCTIPGCENATMTVTKPVTVTVTDGTGQPYSALKVYAFDGSRYTGFNSVTDENGQTAFTLPQGSYRFRADYDGVQFWSSAENDCALPNCTSIDVFLPGGMAETTVTIDYTYDPLYRLTAADYDTGDYYHYTYDSVGNRLTQENSVGGLSVTDTYTYDIANRLVDVDGVGYTWDANGNLLSDGVNSYTYDSANRLINFNGPKGTATYGYNGLGDRLTQNGVTYTLDLNAGLTQILDDGEKSYTYGIGRVSQQQGTTAKYFLSDALGSVRQLADANGEVTLAKSYDPYGSVTQSVGASETSYGFASEYTDANGLIHLRARYYAPNMGRFLSRDTWNGNQSSPHSLNKWNYTESNPINYIDPSGNYCIAGIDIGPWGEKCTKEDRMKAVQQVKTFVRFYNSIQNFKIGFVYELMTSMLVVGPETQKAVWELLKNTQLGKNLETTTALGIALTQMYCGTDVIQALSQPAQAIQRAIVGIAGDPFFTKGRAAGRITAILMGAAGAAWGLSGLTIGLPSKVLLATVGGPPSGGLSTGAVIAIAAVDAGLIVYGGAVVAAALLREANDNLVYSAFAGGGGGTNRPRFPDPGDLTDTGRYTGRPPKRTPGIYEFIDQKNGKWYVGQSSDLRARLQDHIRTGRLASYDDVVWTEIEGGSQYLDVAEMTRIEQVASRVGGRSNMSNAPISNPINPAAAQDWLIRHPNIPGWPEWLYWP